MFNVCLCIYWPSLEEIYSREVFVLAEGKTMFAPRNVDVDKFERSPTVLFYHQTMFNCAIKASNINVIIF